MTGHNRWSVITYFVFSLLCEFVGGKKTVVGVLLVVMCGGDTLHSSATEEWDRDAE